MNALTPQSLPRIEAFLRGAIGLNCASIGDVGLMHVVRERMRSLGIADEPAYLDWLLASVAEQDALIERVVITETWFFRNDKPFAALREHLRGRAAKRCARQAPLRLLSVPCATGEEPYSLAMTLLDLGLAPEQWRIDACDISRVALERARTATYGAHSFRSRELGFRARYFRPVGTLYVLDESVRASVNFQQGNIIEPGFPRGRPRYDIIFFRNLMIYLGEQEQNQALENIDAMLAPDGWLFVGHTESGLMLNRDYRGVNDPGAFAFQKGGARREGAPAAPDARRVRPATRRAAPSEVPVGIRPGAVPPAPAREARPEVDDRFEEARRFADQGDLDAAQRVCDALLASGPPQPGVFHLLGLIQAAKGESDAAESCFRKTLYLEPDHYEALAHLALLAERRGDVAIARRFRERAARAERLRHETSA